MGLGDLSDTDKAVIREIARAVAREILIEHEQHCTMRWQLRLQWWKWIAITTAGGSIGGLVVKILETL